MSRSKSELCLECLECCRVVKIPVNNMVMDEFYRARGIRHSFEEGGVFLVIPSVCPQLTSGGCGIYEDRPDACRRYDGRNDPVVNCRWVK